MEGIGKKRSCLPMGRCHPPGISLCSLERLKPFTIQSTPRRMPKMHRSHRTYGENSWAPVYRRTGDKRGHREQSTARTQRCGAFLGAGDRGQVLMRNFAVRFEILPTAWPACGFRSDPAVERRRVSELSGKHFDGHIASELGIPRAIHFAHPALAQLFEDLVVRNASPDHDLIPFRARPRVLAVRLILIQSWPCGRSCELPIRITPVTRPLRQKMLKRLWPALPDPFNSV